MKILNMGCVIAATFILTSVNTQIFSTDYKTNKKQFEYFLKTEVDDCIIEIDSYINKIENGLDVSQYYYFVGKRIESEYILKEWNRLNND